MPHFLSYDASDEPQSLGPRSWSYGYAVTPEMVKQYTADHNYPHPSNFVEMTAKGTMLFVDEWANLWNWFTKDLERALGRKFDWLDCCHEEGTLPIICFVRGALGNSPTSAHENATKKYGDTASWHLQECWADIAERIGLDKEQAPQWYKEVDDNSAWTPEWEELRREEEARRKEERKARKGERHGRREHRLKSSASSSTLRPE